MKEPQVSNQSTYRQRLRDAAASAGVPKAKMTPQEDVTVIITQPASAAPSGVGIPDVVNTAEKTEEPAAQEVTLVVPEGMTPEQMRSYAQDLVIRLLDMPDDAYAAHMTLLQQSYPAIYGIVSDELENLNASATPTELPAASAAEVAPAIAAAVSADAVDPNASAT